MYCIGLTGQIASGKSTAATHFAALGIDVISADQLAKALTSSTQPAFQKIVDHFGKQVLQAQGQLDRQKLRTIIFHNAEQRLWLEQLLHPLIKDAIKEALKTVKSPYVIIEIPLLFDKKEYPYLDRVLLVHTTKEQQAARFIARDKGSQHDITAILAAQPEAKKLLALADDVLLNEGTISEFKNKILALHRRYLHDCQIS